MPGNELIDGGTANIVFPPIVTTACQPGRGSCTVTVAAWRPQISHEDEFRFQLIERFHPGVQFVQFPIRADSFRSPRPLGAAVGEVEIGEVRGGSVFSRRLSEAFQRRQGETGPEIAEESPAISEVVLRWEIHSEVVSTLAGSRRVVNG